MESRSHAEDNILCFFFPPKQLYLCKDIFAFHFFYLLSSPLYKKAQTTTFLIKFLRCFFPPLFLLFFLLFLGLENILLFDFFFLQANSRVWRGPRWLIFAVRHATGCRVVDASKPFFPWSCDTTLLIPLVDFYGCLL